MIDEFEENMNHQLKEYSGRLVSYIGFYISPVITKGLSSYNNMKSRCKSNIKYKGLSVSMTSRQFLYWWVIQNRFFIMDEPSIGRIDHSCGYCFENMRLESLSDNGKEVRNRTGSRVKPYSVKMIKNEEHLAIASSLRQAANYSKMDLKSIQNCIRSPGRIIRGWRFELDA